LRNLAQFLPGVEPKRAQAIIVMSPDGNIPAELQNDVALIEWPMPDRYEIASILEMTLRNNGVEASEDERQKAIEAAIGLSGTEVENCFSNSLVRYKRIDPVAVANEKKSAIAKTGALEWHDPIPAGLDAIGGLDALKTWLMQRAVAWSPAARAYGLPAPKGVILVGISGCGKTLTAKAVATAWQCPLVRFDPNAARSKYVGESEQMFRRALKIVEALGLCVLWIDEGEKAFAGASQGASDGGVSSDALGTLLTWLQEKTSPTFVFITCNDVRGLPPELLRKGRFDELFFVDLPTLEERCAIVRAALRANKRADDCVDCDAIAKATDACTGAEIASLIPEAMYIAYPDGAREITTQDVLTVADRGRDSRLSETAKDKIQNLRDWAKGKARNASAVAVDPIAAAIRKLDI
jgi:ATP-dependent 26S proteasome regulatory subunit